MRVILIDRHTLPHEEEMETIPLCEEMYDGYDKPAMRAIVRSNVEKVVSMTRTPELGLEK